MEGTADTGLDRLGDAQMQKWVKAWGGVLVGTKDGSVGGKVCRGGWGSTGTLCFSVGSGQAPGTLGLWVIQSGAELGPSLTPHPSVLPQLPVEFSRLRRRRQCCGQGMQLGVLALVTAALWAGLTTLLLLWREDTPSPTGSPFRPWEPRFPMSPPLPTPVPPPTESPLLSAPPPPTLPHTVNPRPPSQLARGVWVAGALRSPSFCLLPRLGWCAESEASGRDGCVEQ